MVLPLHYQWAVFFFPLMKVGSENIHATRDRPYKMKLDFIWLRGYILYHSTASMMTATQAKV